jgi:diguanylate cyclase (GGDEF)-like protein
MLRSYDVIVRYGGDEFVCVLSQTTTDEARGRFSLLDTALSARPVHGSVSVGLAELRPCDSVDDIVARADAALCRTRRRRNAGATGVPR